LSAPDAATPLGPDAATPRGAAGVAPGDGGPTPPRRTGSVEPRLPLHLAVIAGASTAIYAVSLAGVTALQSQTDAARVADLAPVSAAADRLTAGHDRLEDSVTAAERRYASAADDYDTLTARLAAVEAALSANAKRMTAIGGAANSLPSKVSLPTVSRSVTRTVSKPAVHTTTGASGKP